MFDTLPVFRISNPCEGNEKRAATKEKTPHRRIGTKALSVVPPKLRIGAMRRSSRLTRGGRRAIFRRGARKPARRFLFPGGFQPRPPSLKRNENGFCFLAAFARIRLNVPIIRTGSAFVNPKKRRGGGIFTIFPVESGVFFRFSLSFFQRIRYNKDE